MKNLKNHNQRACRNQNTADKWLDIEILVKKYKRQNKSDYDA